MSRAQCGRPLLAEDVVALNKRMLAGRQCGLPGRMRPGARSTSGEN